MRIDGGGGDVILLFLLLSLPLFGTSFQPLSKRNNHHEWRSSMENNYIPLFMVHQQQQEESISQHQQQQQDSELSIVNGGIMANNVEMKKKEEELMNNNNNEKNNTTTTRIKPAITPNDEICFCINVLERLKNNSMDPIIKMSGYAIMNSLSWSYLNKIPVDSKFYNSVLELLSRNNNNKGIMASAPQDAMDILRQMEDVAAQQKVSSSTTTTTTNVRPTLDTYIHVMKTWINAEKSGIIRNGHLVAEMLLIELWEKYNSGQHDDLKPDSSIYKRILNAWARRSTFDPQARKQATFWLKDMIRRYNNDGRYDGSDLRPAPVHFNAVLQCIWSGQEEEDSETTELYIKELMDLEEPFQHTDSWSDLYLNLFREFNVREDPAGTGKTTADAALRLLKYVKTTGDDKKRNILIPRHERDATEMVVRELCFSDRLYEADALLKGLQARYEAGEGLDIKPTPEALDILFEMLCRTRPKQSPKEQQAEELLRTTSTISPKLKEKDQKIQLRHFENAIAGWTSSAIEEKEISPSPREVSRAEDLFHEMQDDFSLDPTPFIYQRLVQAWAFVETNDAPSKAQFHLSEMLLRLKKGDDNFKPKIQLFEYVIMAWLRIGRPEKAESVIRVMNFLGDNGVLDNHEGSTGGGARARSYDAVIMTWATGPQRRDTGDRAMALYHEMRTRGIPVSNMAYTYLLDIWTRRPGAYSMKMVNRLFDDYQNDQVEEPALVVYNLVLKMWCNDRIPGFDDSYSIVRAERLMDEMRANESIKPDIISYTTMMQLLSKCRDWGAPEKAEELLDEVKGQAPHVKPDVQLYNALIAVWARSKRNGSTQRVLQLLNEMTTSPDESIQPDIYTMNTVISTIARGRGGGTSSPQRAKAMIDSMWESYEAGESNVKPDLITYNTLAGAWSRFGTEEAPIQATMLLKEMWKLYNDGKLEQCPDNRTYSSVIAAWARSDHPAAAERAEQILKDLRGRYHASGNDRRFRPDRVIMQHMEDVRSGRRRGRRRQR